MIRYTSNRDHSGSFLVYINKIEIPSASVRVKYGVWGIPQGTLTLAPDPVLQRLGAEDRVQVEVFFIDDFLLTDSGEEAIPRLLFEGEITGWNYSNTPNSRAISFAIDNQMAIMQQLFVQFLSNLDDMAGAAVNIADGVANFSPTRSELVFPFSLFTQGLIGSEQITRPFDFLYNIIKVIIGSDAPVATSSDTTVPVAAGVVPAKQRAVPAANFFARWVRLTNFQNRFVACPVFDEGTGSKSVFPVLKAVNQATAIDTLTRSLMGQLQNAGSFWDMLQVVLQTFFEEIAMIPTAPLVSVDLKTSQILPTDFTKNTVSPGAQPLRDAQAALLIANKTVIDRQIDAASATLAVEDAVKSRNNDQLNAANAELATATTALNAATKAQIAAQNAVKNPGQSLSAMNPPDPLHPLRLVNYFVKPQFIFGLPPSCNVIFPSMIEMFDYSENYATQATRLYFNDETLNRLFKIKGQLDPAVLNALAVSYPPTAQSFQADKKNNIKSTGKNFLLFPEEFYKGPVMDRRSLPTWLFFLKMSEQQAAGKSDANSSNTGTVPTAVDPKSPDTVPPAAIPYPLFGDTDPDVYHLYAEYEYFRERYSRRSGAVICKFNPFIVPGFPAIIFDNRATRVDIFCYVTAVEHTLQARSIQTTVSYAYGRTFQEAMDTLRNDFADGSASYAVSPREPIRDVRNVIQHFQEAENFYQALFFGRPVKTVKDAAADWRKLVAFASAIENDPPDPILLDDTGYVSRNTYDDARNQYAEITAELTLVDAFLTTITTANETATAELAKLGDLTVSSPVDAQAAEAATQAVADTAQQLKTVLAQQALLLQRRAALTSILDATVTIAASNNVPNNLGLNTTRELVPASAFEDAFTSFDAAMAYVWRPICSLDEYLIFTGGSGENPTPAFGAPFSIGAQFYERIGRLIPLTPDFKFPTGADGLALSPTAPPPTTAAAAAAEAVGAGVAASTIPGIDNTFPQTRADWSAALLAYRNNVYLSKVPRG